MRILMTGGRAPVCLDLARQFWRDGHTVFVAESQRVQLCRTSRAVRRTFSIPPPRQEPEAFAAAVTRLVREQRIDVFVPTCEEIFYLARARSLFPPSCRVWVDEPDKLDELHDKFRFAALAKRVGFDVPESHLIESATDLARYSARNGEWIMKPVFSRFGLSVRRGTVGELIDDRSLSRAIWPMVLQRFVVGHEICAYAVCDGGALKAFSLYAHEFVAGRAGITFEEVENARVRDHVVRLARELDFTGQLAFDFILDAEGTPWVLECNPRATSGIHLLARTLGLASVFTTPDRVTTPVRAERGTRAMLGLPTILFGPLQIRSFSKFGAWVRALTLSRDAVFRARDPVPFFDQIVCTLALVLAGRRAKLDPLAASTMDIEWNGSP